MKWTTILFASGFILPLFLTKLHAEDIAGSVDRSVLPIKEPLLKASTILDVRNATPPPRFEVKAPAGAPKVLLVLVDDLGFAGTSTFGGPTKTPTFDRIARGGLRFNNFHTTAVC